MQSAIEDGDDDDLYPSLEKGSCVGDGCEWMAAQLVGRPSQATAKNSS